jgi:hypothetical protein
VPSHVGKEGTTVGYRRLFAFPPREADPIQPREPPTRNAENARVIPDRPAHRTDRIVDVAGVFTAAGW